MSAQGQRGAFYGARECIADAFGYDRRQETLRQLCKRMCAAPIPRADYVALVANLYELVGSNCRQQSTSKQNWRWKPQTRLNSENRDKETLLERAVAILTENGHLPDWSNQIPVISGHATKQQKKCAVDLARRSGERLELIELKWQSDTPTYAAFEILLYGLAYVFCRLSLRYQDRSTMGASVISLNVLAPASFYKGINLGRLESGLSQGFSALMRKRLSEKPAGELRLLQIPSDFTMPFETGADVMKGCGRKAPGPTGLAVIDALRRIEPVYP